MAELVVTTSLDRSGFDKGVTELTNAIAQVSAKPLKLKIDGDFSKMTADIAKVIVAQEKTAQAVERTKQVQISANAAIAASAARVVHCFVFIVSCFLLFLSNRQSHRAMRKEQPDCTCSCPSF